MKNYNGSHLSPSNNFTNPKLLSTTPLSNTIKSPSSSEETFTLKDLKHEYTKALSFIDKLKAEQNSIKNHLRMALDQQAQPASTPVEESYSPRNHSARLIKRNVTRDSDTRMTDLEIENSELKSQLDTALIRISKLQREKQTLQDHLQESEIQTSPNRELASEVRSLTSEVRTLKARLQEAEEENIRLSRQKSHDRISQKPSQSLIRYINYVSKLVSSMSPASFGRSCYEERFPKGVDVYELLESGQNEAVLLKAYKYITDLLININSVSSEESTFRIREPAVSEPISQVPSRYGSRRSSPTNVRSNGEGFSKKLQPSQDGFRPKLQFETLETVSTVTAKTPGSEEYAGYTGNEASQSSEYEQSRRNLQRIVGGPEENKGYKKPQKKHTRHSSSIIGGYNSYKPVHDSLGIEGSLVETKGCWDSRAFSYNAEEYNYSVKNRRLRDDAEIKGMEEEVPESSPALNVRPAKVERPAREVEEEEDREEKKRVRYRDLEVKANKGGYGKEDDEEEMYRSEFVKARVAGVRSDKDERREVRRDEGERRTMDGYGQIKKRARENNEEDYRRRYEVKEEEDEEKGQERIGYNGSKGRGFRSRSMPKEDEIIEETMESEKGGDVSQSRQVERKKRENRKRVNEEKEEEDEDGSERNEVWERRREELARVNKGANANTNASANTSMELKGKDFNTFSVSFGRTESKKKVSLSPDAKTASSIMDVPRKKRVEHISVNYDVITGKEKKSMGSIVKKYEEKSPTVSFADEEGEPKRLKKKNSSMANLKKIVGDAENMG